MQKKDFNISALRVFLAVCDFKSMSRAAKHLNMTQSGISRSITTLEDVLGVKLFDRNFSPMQLTLNGRFIRNRTMSILENIDMMTEGLNRFQDKQNIDLRFGSSTSITFTIAPYLFEHFVGKVNYLTTTTGSTPDICKKLMDDELDIALATNPMISHKFITAIPIYSEPYLVVLPCEYDKFITSRKDLIELAKKLPCVQFASSTLDSVHLSRILRQWGVQQPNLELNSIDAVIHLVSIGKAWSLMPAMNIHTARITDPVSYRQISHQQGRRTAYILYKDSAYEELALFTKEKSLEILKTKVLPSFADKSISEAITIIEENEI